MNRRYDRISTMLIDAVLDASRQHGIALAARLPHEDGVPLDVALRVLTRPASRHHADRRRHVVLAAAAALVKAFGSGPPPLSVDGSMKRRCTLPDLPTRAT